MPSGMPIAVASSSATVASTAVLSARSPSSVLTGREYSSEWPKSKRTAPPQPRQILSGDGPIEPELGAEARACRRDPA